MIVVLEKIRENGTKITRCHLFSWQPRCTFFFLISSVDALYMHHLLTLIEKASDIILYALPLWTDFINSSHYRKLYMRITKEKQRKKLKNCAKNSKKN